MDKCTVDIDSTGSNLSTGSAIVVQDTDRVLVKHTLTEKFNHSIFSVLQDYVSCVERGVAIFAKNYYNIIPGI